MTEFDSFDWDSSQGSRESDPQTSKDAAEEIAPSLPSLQAEFLAKLSEVGEATSNEVAALVAGNNFARRNTMRRRASDLIAKKRIEAVGSRVCRVTHRKATVYRVAKVRSALEVTQ